MTPLQHFQRVAAVSIVALCIAGPGFAKDKGDEGHGKSDKHAQKHEDKAEHKADKHAEKQHREDIKAGAYFNEQHRQYAREYYTKNYRGHCPPGLAKKNNGCMPPGQARTWVVGQPVPRDVVFYAVPQPVMVHLPPAPYGYRYARIGNDIVLMQQQNRLVIDIIIGLV